LSYTSTFRVQSVDGLIIIPYPFFRVNTFICGNVVIL